MKLRRLDLELVSRGVVDSRLSTLAAVEKALSRAGVEFIPAGDKGEGVRLVDPQA